MIIWPSALAAAVLMIALCPPCFASEIKAIAVSGLTTDIAPCSKLTDLSNGSAKLVEVTTYSAIPSDDQQGPAFGTITAGGLVVTDTKKSL